MCTLLCLKIFHHGFRRCVLRTNQRLPILGIKHDAVIEACLHGLLG